ncbi:AlpA family transcriptional regulator [Gammaproteobacteria bacterium LSUCC0112]|nr:AlpA family transcriptional regulator [Gammaproteobacteria bacterium LSUCC0112]
MSFRILRIHEVIQKTGLGKSTIYWLISKGEFPQPVKLGARSIGFPDTDINEWLNTRLQRRDNSINPTARNSTSQGGAKS